MAKTDRRRSRQQTEPVLITLENGLRVIMQEVHFAPVVSMAVWVGVGSADELPTEAGLAHLNEHMVFKGTARRGVGEIASQVEGAGGEINAFTSYDQTCYYLTLGRDELNLGLDILADAIGGAAFDRNELKKEIQVILEEIRLYRDLPHYHVSEACWGKAFELHPYGRPILGSPDVLKALKRAGALRFFRKHYRPENLVLSVAGDLSIAETTKLVKKLFGGLPAGHVRRGERPVEPAQARFRGLALDDPIREAHLNLAWHGPRWDDPQAAHLDLLAIILGHGYSSRLEHRVKAIKGLVHDVSAHVFAPRDPGVFGIDAATAPDLVRDAYRAILTEVYRLRSEPVREQEIERAKRTIEASFIGRRETAAGIGHALGYSVSMTGDIHLVRNYLAHVLAADREDLRNAARGVLSHANLTATALMPKKFELNARELEKISHSLFRVVPTPSKITNRVKPREAPPLIGEAGRRGRLKKAVLKNGAVLIVQESAHAPIVAIRTMMSGGMRHEPTDQNGIANLTANLLARGTIDKSAITFAKIVEGMAGSLRGVSGFNSVGIASEFLSRDFGQGLELVAEAMLTPSFRQTELRRAKDEIIGHIRERLDSPSAVARDALAGALYPNHPYGRAIWGSEESLTPLDADAVSKHWNRLLSARNLVISIAGDVAFEDALERVEALFGRVRVGRFKPIKLAEPPMPEGVLRVRQFMKRDQVHLLAGFLGCRIGEPDEDALHVLNAVLSGQGGRLFLELRDKRHLAYSVHSFQRGGVERGSFGVYIGTSPETAAQAESAMLAELEKVINQPPKGAELERAKRNLIGSLQLDLQTAGAVALTTGINELLGQGYRSHLRLAEKIRRVDAKRVARVARKYITLDNMVLARVGVD